MKLKNITVAGCGVLGSQIAFQTAFKGFKVAVYDVDDAAIEHGKTRILKLMSRYQKGLGISEDQFMNAFHRISFHRELTRAVADADLLIEAIPEVAEVKSYFYNMVGWVAPKKTIFVTNSSMFLPSQFAEATHRPAKFLALHFANNIWLNNTAEIMKHPGTDMKVFQEVVEFAEAIGMIALPLHKEQPGYILNSLLLPLLEGAGKLLVNEVSDIETIDKTWVKGSGAPIGPFAMLDMIGIQTAYNIIHAKAEWEGDPELIKLADYLKTEYLDKGKLGRETGEGFYKYAKRNSMEQVVNELV